MDRTPLKKVGPVENTHLGRLVSVSLCFTVWRYGPAPSSNVRRQIPGCGPKLQALLGAHGITETEHIRVLSAAQLASIIGQRLSPWLIDAAVGRSAEPVLSVVPWRYNVALC
jgi:hypothetical protein